MSLIEELLEKFLGGNKITEVDDDLKIENLDNLSKPEQDAIMAKKIKAKLGTDHWECDTDGCDHRWNGYDKNGFIICTLRNSWLMISYNGTQVYWETKEPDGSKDVVQYIPGEWEEKLREIYSNMDELSKENFNGTELVDIKQSIAEKLSNNITSIEDIYKMIKILEESDINVYMGEDRRFNDKGQLVVCNLYRVCSYDEVLFESSSYVDKKSGLLEVNFFKNDKEWINTLNDAIDKLQKEKSSVKEDYPLTRTRTINK